LTFRIAKSAANSVAPRLSNLPFVAIFPVAKGPGVGYAGFEFAMEPK